MQVVVENISTLERKLTVRLPADALESRVRQRLQELGRTARIKGFRPGKIPSKVIEQRFGPQVRHEELSGVVRTSLNEAIQKENLRPAASPSVTNPAQSAAEIEYSATFEIVPEIGNIDVAALQVTRYSAEITDADIDRMIDTLRTQRRQWLTVERSSQAGDMVLFEFSATTTDSRFPEDGMHRAGTVIGSGALFSDFEALVTGVNAGQDIKTTLQFPDNFREASLAGKSAQIELNIIRIQEAKLPDIDDAFMASFGLESGGIERFRKEIKANLERERNAALRARLKQQVIEKLLTAYPDFELPKSMVASEVRALFNQATEHAKRTNTKPPHDLQEFQTPAKQRVRAFLLLMEIARQHKMSPDSKQVAERIAEIASTYEDPQQVMTAYAQNQQARMAIEERVLEDQVAAWIAEQSKTEIVPLSFQEALQLPA